MAGPPARDFLVRADGTIMHALAGICSAVACDRPASAEFKLVQTSLR
ncbi:MAG: hypothetical protein U5L05_16005 [Rubrivivax sp.]|nr:hypothetical protein [Rubrivivax sp.]